ncbi:MAG: non-homologous end-joining DNA ligase [Mycobacteriales bacterium]
MAATSTTVTVDGRQLRLSNLDKPLYPDGFTKGEVIDYYRRVAPAMVPGLAGRPATFVRFPNGVGHGSFFEKNAAKGRPDWVRTVRLPAPGSSKDREEIDYAVVDDLPTLVWAANLAALEIHVPQWQVGPRGGVHDPDLVVVDLDPGSPATIVECCRVALLVRDRLGESAVAKTSGSKGLQLYARWDGGDSREAMHDLARELEREHEDLVVSRMAKALRPGKVLFDWSQNNVAKTTVAAYSLRGRDRPTVSTPLTWDEVEACTDPAGLAFTADDVLDRLETHGDLFAPLRVRR